MRRGQIEIIGSSNAGNFDEVPMYRFAAGGSIDVEALRERPWHSGIGGRQESYPRGRSSDKISAQ